MTKDIQKKLDKEKTVVTFMIGLYCRKNHGTAGGLCPECEELAKYACDRSDHCPFIKISGGGNPLFLKGGRSRLSPFQDNCFVL